MNAQPFCLLPFPSPPPPPNIEITGMIARHGDQLTFRYQLWDPLKTVVIPARVTQPARQDNLWQTTCFEFFLGMKQSPTYWEVNLSPAGHWNVYRFRDYRQGMQAELAFDALPFRVEAVGEVWGLELVLDLEQIMPANQNLEIGISAVLESQGGGLTYWALTHPGPQADFHQRQGFLIRG